MTENGPKPHSVQTSANVIDEGALTKGQVRRQRDRRAGVRRVACFAGHGG